MKTAAKLLTAFFCLSLVFLSYQSGASSPGKQEVTEVTRERWEHYATDEDDTGYFFNSDTIRHAKGGLVRVWVRAIYSEKNPKYSEAKFQWEIDCTKKKMRGLKANAKKKDGTSAIITESSDWSVIPSESTAETLSEKVCRKKNKRTP